MVGRALSNQVKKQAARRQSNTIHQAAVDEYLQEQPSNKRRGFRPIAQKHGINHKTLANHVNGGQTMSAFNASKQKLTSAEEHILVDFILASANRGIPLSLKNIEVHADAILAGREQPGVTVGRTWADRFLQRHRNKLQTHWSRPLATERARSLNPEAVKAWYELVDELIVKQNIKPENIYGMDESGFPPSNQGKERVVGRQGSKMQHRVGSANRENVTAIVTICADGTVLQPTIIFKGKNFLNKWGGENVAKASLCVSDNGWTDGGLALEWIQHDFDRQTREKAAGETRVLLMDGHNSHYTADLLEYCVANSIEVLGYPPHCTHALQGLDVVCFAKMKEAWKEEINAFEKKSNRGVNKEDFCGVFGCAFLRAFTPDVVQAAFSATGIHPFNPNVITPQQMQPSETTSTRASFPQLQSSPTRAVMSAFRDYNFTYEGLHPESPPRAGPSTFSGSLPAPFQTPRPADPAPTTPKRRCDPASDPNLPTPSKRMRLLGVGLANTASGSFLVTKAKTTHLEMKQIIALPVIERVPRELEPPDWSLLLVAGCTGPMKRQILETRHEALETSLRRAQKILDAQALILEAQNAQLIIQNMGLIKMNETLHEKENKKKSDRTILFPGGKGRHLTDQALIQKKRELEEEKRKEEADKEGRKAAKDNRKAEKEKLEEVWKVMLEEYAQALADWTVERQALREGGTLVKDLPRKPKRPLKPKPKEPEGHDEEGPEQEDEDDD